MRIVAPGVHQLRGMPPNAINIYLAGDVLVDSGTPGSRRRILRQIAGRDLTAHVVTHAHPDHFGSSHKVCGELGIPLWIGAGDVEALRTASPAPAKGRLPALMARTPMPPGHTADRALVEGDEVAGFTVLEVPGHSPGHIALWRESDRTLIAGDVFFNLGRLTAPPSFLTFDPERNRESMRRLAAVAG
jgi:hydroxyacylglutathione hydrolase